MISNFLKSIFPGHWNTQACPVFPHTWRVLCWPLSPNRRHWRHLQKVSPWMYPPQTLRTKRFHGTTNHQISRHISHCCHITSRKNCLFLVDTVASLGAAPIFMDKQSKAKINNGFNNVTVCFRVWRHHVFHCAVRYRHPVLRVSEGPELASWHSTDLLQWESMVRRDLMFPYLSHKGSQLHTNDTKQPLLWLSVPPHSHKMFNRKTKPVSYLFDMTHLSNYWGCDGQPARV